MLSEGRAWWQLLPVLPSGTPSLRARSLTDLGWLAAYQGDFDVAADAGEQAVALAAEPDWVRANALGVPGTSLLLGEHPELPSAGSRRRWIYSRADIDGAVMVPDVLMHLGIVAAAQDDFVAARRWYEAALAALPPDGWPSPRALVLSNLALLEWAEGDRQRAAVLEREALALHKALGEVYRLEGSFEGAAEHAAMAGQADAAARLLGAAAALRTRIGVAITPFNLETHESLLTRTREQLGVSGFDVAWSQGEGLALEDAIAEADAVLAQAEQRDSGSESVQ